MTSRIQVLGIDAGGTMTDTFFVDTNGNFVVGKAQSTPQDESLGLVNSSVDALAQWNLAVEDVFPQLATAVYSGTAMLNRIVQRKGMRVGLIVNRGMEDFHRMGRSVQSYLGYSYEDRLHLNTHRYDPPLVPRDLTFGVTERIDMFGRVVIPLREQEAYEAARQLVSRDVEGIVISFLHAYKNPAHERRVRDIVLEVVRSSGKDIPVFASSDYYPVRKESHRTNTTILEAYAAEPSRKTLVKINDRFKEYGARFDLRVMASHGGTISWTAKELARTVVSGPIGGVIGTRYLGEQLGYRNIAATDIGGTSFDMALVVQGQFTIQHDPDMARLVLSLPLVQMDSVGSGAGSYVRIDPYTRAIRIGPDSAGYRVGVCWRESGVETVTVSDCHVVLGYINPENFLGGQIRLDVERARRAIEEQVARPLGLSVEEAAAGVIELLDTRLRDHLRAMISGKGYHPSDFVCFSYGGAGPVHTYGYTDGLGFQEIIIPAWAAGFSAFGCATAEFEYRYDKSLDINVAPDADDAERLQAVEELQSAWTELAEKVIEEFRLNGYSADQVTLLPGYRMMYRGQLNDLEIASPLGRIETAEDWEVLTDAFENTYARVYAKAARSPELGFTITGAIMRGLVESVKPRIPDEAYGGVTPPREAYHGQRPFYFRKAWVKADIWDMDTLRAGNQIEGPAVIEASSTTFVVPPGWVTTLDSHRLFHLKRVE
ncbi:MAG: hydantoinase/oxoprolinase family protein [Alicyclobacillus herbarius]|uniref:hydantoinase/oxoprolinase family protein n=1 Tax=Alicyclobacillus herbarius TaxID=122960 RepID=UPI0023544392|nr:hydantoinase/oxoprolinase family protein [Alicyclobacillus herbarius]MCL6632911.1 hydantoinase/oxoprolinase family protein [Alicyclobacillus herbarius]